MIKNTISKNEERQLPLKKAIRRVPQSGRDPVEPAEPIGLTSDGETEAAVARETRGSEGESNGRGESESVVTAADERHQLAVTASSLIDCGGSISFDNISGMEGSRRT
jgi:hypothetical protein